jgi:hypothetical protein
MAVRSCRHRSDVATFTLLLYGSSLSQTGRSANSPAGTQPRWHQPRWRSALWANPRDTVARKLRPAVECRPRLNGPLKQSAQPVNRGRRSGR